MDSLEARAAEIESVSLATVVETRPRPSEINAVDGRADWVFEYTLHNPGRLPISDVHVAITFPCEVQRRRGDGSIEPPTSTLTYSVALVPPHGSHPARRRRLSIAASDWGRLKDTTVRLTFRTPDAGICVTEWPPTRTGTSRALRRRLNLDGVLASVSLSPHARGESFEAPAKPGTTA